MNKYNGQVDVLVERINNGESPEIIASEEGVKLGSLFQRFRRSGYSWDDCQRKYTKRPSANHQGISSRLLPERAIQVIIQCRGVKADRRVAAIRLDFGTIKEMDRFMGQFEFEWCDREHTYKAIN